MFMFPPNSYVETLIPKVMVWAWDLWEVIRSYGWSPHDGISALISRELMLTSLSLSLSLCYVRTQKQGGSQLQTERRPLPEPDLGLSGLQKCQK